jgi:hypothetical protein
VGPHLSSVHGTKSLYSVFYVIFLSVGLGHCQQYKVTSEIVQYFELPPLAACICFEPLALVRWLRGWLGAGLPNHSIPLYRKGCITAEWSAASVTRPGVPIRLHQYSRDGPISLQPLSNTLWTMILCPEAKWNVQKPWSKIQYKF